MGLYDEYGDLRIQLKVGPCIMMEYKVGDDVEIPDGLYVGWGGFLVVQGGKLHAEYPTMTESWGDIIEADEIMRLNNC